MLVPIATLWAPCVFQDRFIVIDSVSCFVLTPLCICECFKGCVHVYVCVCCICVCIEGKLALIFKMLHLTYQWGK